MKCKLCGHEWNSRIEGKPLACPKCKRYDWEEKEDDRQDRTDKEISG
jgi:predicted Zn-ribbon and HTH transcriptional regulator